MNWVNRACTDIREGAWQVALFTITSKDGIVAAYKAYGQDFYGLADFENEIRQNTGAHRFMFKDFKGKTRSDEGWKTLRAPEHIPPFTLEPSHVRDVDKDGVE